MTDKELLTLAAKAAGLRIEWVDGIGAICINDDGTRGAWWDPLASKADTFDLMVTLRLTVDMTDCECCVGVYANQLEETSMQVPDILVRHSADWPDCVTTDPAQALRIAITRAAAEIGGSKT
jgi:hypothetical protein